MIIREYADHNRKYITDLYFEVPYIEYREDGTIKARGTEDFTGFRHSAQMKCWNVWKPTGEKRSDGANVYSLIGDIYALDRKAANKVAAFRFDQGVQLRRVF